jgi:hypothetical protein
MIGKAFLAAALVVSCIAPAQAQDRSSRRDDYRSKKICKVEARKGSRLGGQRSCKTQAEWDAIAREARLTAEHIQGSTSACLMGSNDPTNPGAGVPNCGTPGN